MEVQPSKADNPFGVEGVGHGVESNRGLSTDVPPIYEKISMGVSQFAIYIRLN